MSVPASIPQVSLQPKWRVTVGSIRALGPGKVDLLEGIGETGSLAAASRKLKMSYMRAWNLLQEMQLCFHEPLVETMRGTGKNSGAFLTETGKKVLALYRQLEEESRQATAQTWEELRPLLVEEIS